MPDVGGVGKGGVTPQQSQPVDSSQQANARINAPDQPVGQPGSLGQPTGIPVPGQGKVLPDVLAGSDATQLIGAERMREAGGVSATERLLGLNQQPSIMGALTAPPGNSDALRHMTPTMRRTMMRGLLDKQRERMRRLARLLRDGRESGGQQEASRQDADERFADALLTDALALDEMQLARARAELGNAARMLDLLDELLIMQDYAISQMSTFAQG
ncbi:MAG: hypothetical protein QOD00_3353 [Blastocatellia bacterium]|jgi:hypothetical protein|nr:hypothetical protein [Blastocatellia bacterium]